MVISMLVGKMYSLLFADMLQIHHHKHIKSQNSTSLVELHELLSIHIASTHVPDFVSADTGLILLL